MRASRTTYEHAVIHSRSATLFLDALEVADRFAVASIPRPAVRGVTVQRKDRPPRRTHWFNSKGKRS